MDGPLVISDTPELMPSEGTPVAATGFKSLVLDHVFGAQGRVHSRPPVIGPGTPVVVG